MCCRICSSCSSSESEESDESLSDSSIVPSLCPFAAIRLAVEIGLRGDMSPVDVLRDVILLWTVIRVTSVPTSSPQTSCLRLRTRDRRSPLVSTSFTGVVGVSTASALGTELEAFFCKETIALPRLVVEKTRSGRGFFFGDGRSSASFDFKSIISINPNFLLCPLSSIVVSGRFDAGLGDAG